MTQILNSDPSLKQPKSQQSPLQYFPSDKPSSHKISPIPIIYRKIQNDKRMRKKLVAHGHKNFSKVSACGEDTPLTLGNIVKSNNIKYIRKLEFDPYLCEKSYMKPLSKALKKFRCLQDTNIVIRRLDYMNESDILEPYVVRLIKLKKIRLELTKIEKINDAGMIKLAWMCGRLFSVRESEQVMIGMDHISMFANMHFKKYGSKMIHCTKFKKILQKANLMTAKSEVHPQGVDVSWMRKLRECKQFKEMDFSISIPQGWLSMSTDVDEEAAVRLKTIAAQIHLEKLCFRFSGNPVPLESIQGLSESLPRLNFLRSLGLDFMNSQMSEAEIVLFAQLLPELKSLERLKFKVIQYPNVSEGCIYYLINVISKLPNIKHVEIYFRRLDTSSKMVQELVKRINSLETIECCCSKQSLSFTRTNQDL